MRKDVFNETIWNIICDIVMIVVVMLSVYGFGYFAFWAFGWNF